MARVSQNASSAIRLCAIALISLLVAACASVPRAGDRAQGVAIGRGSGTSEDAATHVESGQGARNADPDHPSSAATPDQPAPIALAPNEVDGAQARNVRQDIQDPWEAMNRKVYRFNKTIDRHLVRPVASAYVRYVPKPVRHGASNFFDNLRLPVTIVNATLQGKPEVAGRSLGRFAVNSTVGVAGILDPASRLNLAEQRTDFGQTLSAWGWKHTRFVMLPVFGPSTVRDSVGLVAGIPLSPLRYVELDKARIALQGLQVIDLRAGLLPLDDLVEGAPDDYTLVRDAWIQRQKYRAGAADDATGDQQEDALPDYMRETGGKPN